MTSLNPHACAWLADRHGVAAGADLRRLGVTARQLDYLVKQGVFERLRRDVFRLTAAAHTVMQDAAAACTAHDGVVLAFTSAGRLWDLRQLGRDRRLHVLVPGHSTLAVPGAVLHRCNRIDRVDIVQRSDGIRVTSPPRTAFDLAAVLSDDALGSVIEQLLDQRRCTMPTLLATGRRLRRPGRAGSARFIRVVQSRPMWLKPAGSQLELRVERAIIAAGLPRPLRQHAIRLADGETVHPDYFWPPQREALEIDHVTWHGGRLDQAYDKRRDRQLWRQGIHVTRVTDEDVRLRLPDVIGDLAAVLQRSGEG